IRQTLTREGFLEVTLDGRVHSSDPASAVFDPNLAGASADTLAAVRFDGRGQDKLIVDHDQLSGGFIVSAAGADVAINDVAAAGPLAIQARSITVSQTLRGSEIALSASGLLSIEAHGQVKANGPQTGDGIEATADVFVNAGQMHADGSAGGQVEI